MTDTAQAPATTGFPDCIARALDQIEVQRSHVLNHLAEARFAEDLVARHKEAIPSLRVSSIGYHSGSLGGVLVFADVKSPREVTGILREARAHLGKMLRVEDYAEIGRRTYHFGKLTIGIFLGRDGDSTACRFVKIGEKTEPIYQLLCPDGTTPEAIAPEVTP